jgi:hypothetical protein
MAFLDRLVKTTEEILPLFYRCSEDFEISEKPGTVVRSWPYAVSYPGGNSSKPHAPSAFSASTHCMILFAVDAFRHRDKERFSYLLGTGFRPGQLPKAIKAKLWEVTAQSKKVLADVLTGKTQPIVTSSTYGRNDPFTLTWLTELAFRSDANEFDNCKQAICKAVDDVLSDARSKTILATKDVIGAFSQVTGSFLKVRRLHLAKAIERLARQAALKSTAPDWLKKPEHWQDFDTTVRRQLSYSAVGDTKFDPAELAFAFEGALLLNPNWISRPTADQVFEALKLSGQRQPLWRPVTPFLMNERGQVLFLVSIEVANSILRACEILDADNPVPARFARFEPQLRTYATWLLGEIEQFPDKAPGGTDGNDEGKLVGWHSEYWEQHGTIHLWYTSHVAVFLLHYASFLRRKIAAEGVEAAGLHLRLPKSIKKFEDYWTDEPLLDLAGSGRKHYAVHDSIVKQYISARVGPEVVTSFPHSMLLYGPPGTGKTTVAEQMAASLKRALIVVTVSDFLAAGAAELENRAQGVFDVLQTQEDVIILFDEIDQFLLDRNSHRYQRQDDVFKFMTPGMLTKLQDLRDAENCIFIVATNYYERIDSAIKRRGRIDEHFLLCVPDRKRRRALLERFASELLEGGLENKATREAYLKAAQMKDWPPKFDANTSVKDQYEKKLAAVKEAVGRCGADLDMIAARTPFYGYGDLKNLVASRTMMKILSSKVTPSLADAMKEATSEVEPAVNLSAYRSRFKSADEAPFEEFFLLVYLLAESGQTLSKEDKDKLLSAEDEESIYDALDRIPGSQEKTLDQFLDQKFIKEKKIGAQLKKFLRRCFGEWKERHGSAKLSDKQGS